MFKSAFLAHYPLFMALLGPILKLFLPRKLNIVVITWLKQTALLRFDSPLTFEVSARVSAKK